MPILNIRHRPKRRIVPLAATAAAVVVASMVVAACGSSSSSDSKPAGSHAPIKVTLILKDLSNPYWIFMRNAAKAEAAKLGVSLKVFAGQTDSDTTTQINAIEDAISAGDSGIIVVRSEEHTSESSHS